MSGKGDRWDNAVVENFLATLKLELARDFDRWYCRQGRQSTLGYMSPASEEQWRGFMTVTGKLFRNALALSMILSLAGCKEHSAWSALTSRPTIDDPHTEHDVHEASLVFDRFVGEGILEDVVEEVASSSDGRMAIVEGKLCRITIFGPPNDSVHFRVGGPCGGGGQEFMDIGAIAFSGATLLVWDSNRGEIVRVSPSGQILDRRPVVRLTGGQFNRLRRMIGTGPDEIAVMNPNRSSHFTGLIISLTEEVVVDSFAKLALGAQDRETVLDIGSNFCSTTWNGRDVLVEANPWAFEAIATSRQKDTLWTSRTSLPWFDGRRSTYQGMVIPGGVVRPILCGPNFVLMRATKTLPSAPRNAPWEGGLVELRDEAGRLLLRQAVDSTAEVLFQRGGALGENSFFLIDPASTYPRLQVFSIAERLSTPIVLAPKLTTQ